MLGPARKPHAMCTPASLKRPLHTMEPTWWFGITACAMASEQLQRLITARTLPARGTTAPLGRLLAFLEALGYFPSCRSGLLSWNRPG